MAQIALIGGYYAIFLMTAGLVGWWLQGGPIPSPYYQSVWVKSSVTIWTWIMAPIAAVIVHELGHYWAARGAGMRVEAIVVFGIGWDFVQKRLYRERQANVGGYVRANSQYLTEREHRRYVLGGPMMNLAVFALVIPLLRFAPPLKSKRSFFPSLARTERWLSSTCCHLTRAGSHPMVDNSATCSAVGATTSGKSWRRSLRFASA